MRTISLHHHAPASTTLPALIYASLSSRSDKQVVSSHSHCDLGYTVSTSCISSFTLPAPSLAPPALASRSEEHTSELQSQ